MFQVALTRLRARWPDVELVVLSSLPQAAAAQFGVAALPLPCFDRVDEAGALFSFQRALDVSADGPASAWLGELDALHDAVAAIRNADALLIAGGGNINAQWPHLVYGRAAALAVAQMHGIPTALTSQTIGPRLTTIQKGILRDLLARVAVIGVRERTSAALLGDLGIADSRLSHQPDDALALTPRPYSKWPVRHGRKVILATLGHGADVTSPLELQAVLLERILAFATSEDAVVALCPHATVDVAHHDQLVARLRPSDRIRTLPLRSAQEIRWMVGLSSLVVSTRYHPLVFALAAAVPAIGIYHGDYTRARILGALSHAHLDGFDLDLNNAAAHIDETLLRVLRSRAELTERLQRARDTALRELDSHWNTLCASLVPVPATPSPVRSSRALPTTRAALAVPPLTVAIDPLRVEGPEAIASARLEGEGLASVGVYFRFPAPVADEATLGDAFLLAFLFPVMRLGRDVHIRSSVSPSLIEHLEDYQGVWASWRPSTYRRVQVTAERLVERAPAAVRSFLFGFSSGLDSSYTAWKMAQKHPRGTGVIVHGYNIPVSDRESGAALQRTARNTLASRGMELISIETNWCQSFAAVDWEDAHGIMVAAALTMVSSSFSVGLIAATGDHRRFDLPKGTHPAIDHLLGSVRFAIRSHGGDAPRLAKLAAVATWPEAFNALHVCWLYGLATNCGRCARCLALAAACTALGLPLPQSLPAERFEPAVFTEVHDLTARDAFVEDMMRAAALTGAKDPLLDDLGRVLSKWRSMRQPLSPRQRLGDVVARPSAAPTGALSQLASRVDAILGNAAWREYVRPALRALRIRT